MVNSNDTVVIPPYTETYHWHLSLLTTTSLMPPSRIYHILGCLGRVIVVILNIDDTLPSPTMFKWLTVTIHTSRSVSDYILLVWMPLMCTLEISRGFVLAVC